MLYTPDLRPSSLSDIEHMVDGWQKIPKGPVIKQEVLRVSEQTKSWLTPPLQLLTDLMLQRLEDRRKSMKGSHRLSINSIGNCVTRAL